MNDVLGARIEVNQGVDLFFFSPVVARVGFPAAP